MLGLSFRRVLAIPGGLMVATCGLALITVIAIAGAASGVPRVDGAMSGPTTTCTSWNLASDFRVYPNQENPSRDSCGNPGVWSYMRSDANRTTFNVLTAFITNSSGIEGLEFWHVPGQPALGYNATGVEQTVDQHPFPANVIGAHPSTSESVTVGWRSPVSGQVSVAGTIADLDPKWGNGVKWYLQKGSDTLASGSIANGGSQQLSQGTGGASLASLPVSAGDFLYVIVDANGDNDCDLTQIDLTITLVSPAYGVSGRVANSSQTPLAGVGLSVNATPVATTNAVGQYSAAFPAGSYALVPSSYCKAFVPEQRIVSVPPAATDQDFVGTDAACVPCTSWNLASDLRVYPNQENPSRDSCGAPGVWRYGYGPLGSHDPQTYTLFTIFGQAIGGITGLDGWYSLPSFGYTTRNVTNSDIWVGPEFHQAGRVNVHPQNNYTAVNTWTSPVTGVVSVTGAVTHRNTCGNGVTWSLDKGSTTLSSGAVSVGGSENLTQGTGGSSLASISVVPGDTISLIVDANGDYSCDSTQIDLTITQTGPFYGVSGRVANASQTPAPGIPIVIAGTPVATTDDAGHYVVSLPAGTYAMAPSAQCRAFSPNHRDVTVPPTVTGQDYTVAAGNCQFMPEVPRQPSPTATPTATSTFTVTPTPTVTTTPTISPIDFLDNFSNPASGWAVYDVSAGAASYVNGEYELIVRSQNTIDFESAPIPLANVSARYTMEVDVRLAYGTGGYGLLFDGTGPDDVYMLSIDPSNSGPWFAVRHYTPGNWQTLKAWTKSTAIRSGTGSNHLKIIRYADAASFYINDQNVAWVDLPAPSVGVWVGLTASNYGTIPASVRFDNFRLVGMPFITTGIATLRQPVPPAGYDIDVPRADAIATPIR